MTAANWIELDGAANARDLGGSPTVDGRVVRPRRLVRADNLQSLSESDVRTLVDDLEVRTVVDLRTGVEVDAEGPGPLTRESDVRIQHLSLFPETGDRRMAGTDDDLVVLPWQERNARDGDLRHTATQVYTSYLSQRPDSVIAALRAIAGSPGASVVHCAAGKDRTGVVIAFALIEVGVERDAVIADYARTAERIEAILDRLRSSSTYAGDLQGDDADAHRPKAITMQRLLDEVDAQFGGVPAWLRDNGWTDADAAALRAKLLD